MTHLRQAMLDELHRRNYAASTITYCIKNVEQFARYFERSPDRLNHSHLRPYQAYLLRQRKLAPRTVRLHICANRAATSPVIPPSRNITMRSRHGRGRSAITPSVAQRVEDFCL